MSATQSSSPTSESPPKITLPLVDQTPRLLAFFKCFLSTLDALENYLFWAELQEVRAQFEASPQDKDLLRMNSWILYQEFLQPGARYEIIIPEGQRKNIFEKINTNQVALEIFAGVETELVLCLQHECLPKFVTSEWFQRYKDYHSLEPEMQLLSRVQSRLTYLSVDNLLEEQSIVFDQMARLEKEYLERVRILVHGFKAELKTVLKNEDFELLFGNIDQIYQVHQHISHVMVPDYPIPQMFQQIILERHFLEIYRLFFTNLPFVRLLFDMLLKEQKIFQKIEDLEKTCVSRSKKTFQQLLFEVPKDHLEELQAVLKLSNGHSISSNEALVQTQRAITELLELAKDNQPTMSQKRLFELRRKLKGYPGNLTKPGRLYIMEGPLLLYNSPSSPPSRSLFLSSSSSPPSSPPVPHSSSVFETKKKSFSIGRSRSPRKKRVACSKSPPPSSPSSLDSPSSPPLLCSLSLDPSHPCGSQSPPSSALPTSPIGYPYAVIFKSPPSSSSSCHSSSSSRRSSSSSRRSSSSSSSSFRSSTSSRCSSSSPSSPPSSPPSASFPSAPPPKSLYWFLFSDKLVSTQQTQTKQICKFPNSPTTISAQTLTGFFKYVNIYPLLDVVVVIKEEKIILEGVGMEELCLEAPNKEEQQKWCKEIQRVGDEWKEQRRQQKNTKDQKLLDIIEKMKIFVKCQDRGLFQKFTGADAVHFFISKIPHVDTKEEGEAIGTQLLQGGFIVSCTNSDVFIEKNSLYYFG